MALDAQEALRAPALEAHRRAGREPKARQSYGMSSIRSTGLEV
jgi:hypothetical protein